MNETDRVARDRKSGIVWLGRPRQGMFFYPFDALRIPFGLILSAFAAIAYFKTGSKVELLFALGASTLWLWKFPWDAFRRSRLRYLITQDRIIIFFGILRTKRAELPISRIKSIGINYDGGKFGDITFEGEGIPTIGLSGFPLAEKPGRYDSLSLEKIENVLDIANQIYMLSGERITVERIGLSQ